MCGIAGVINAAGSPPASATLDRLAQALAHRGPDGQGRHLGGGVGMVQTRLAIIDLETGDQPFYAEVPGGGRTALVANAEIYNYVELRAAMTDTAFATRSDCESALHLYARHGPGFAAHLRGMYAIAIHDPKVAGGRVVLARDPFGIKPLYYAELETGLAFASEPQALIAAGLVAPALDAAERDRVLQMQFSTARRDGAQGHPARPSPARPWWWRRGASASACAWPPCRRGDPSGGAGRRRWSAWTRPWSTA